MGEALARSAQDLLHVGQFGLYGGAISPPRRGLRRVQSLACVLEGLAHRHSLSVRRISELTGPGVETLPSGPGLLQLSEEPWVWTGRRRRDERR
ncbi:MAG: hypothetical protein A2X52_09680 [Candidatus Rokubacteria bacterium GWC2_70_16]|nr:MAG: hypothetical protein A2X52_09680 [Candidatus Rokubacteria bacterium GWC2_70_16]OGK87221.1 MAG: hypothetical protein A2050_15035 [Candidatus Rokubacteria bacterium GWA2_73_35]